MDSIHCLYIQNICTTITLYKDTDYAKCFPETFRKKTIANFIIGEK